MYNVTNYTPIYLSDEGPGCTDLSQVWRMDYISMKKNDILTKYQDIRILIDCFTL